MKKHIGMTWLVERAPARQILSSQLSRIGRRIFMRVALARLHPAAVRIDALLGRFVQSIAYSERVAPLPRPANADRVFRHPPSLCPLPLHTDGRFLHG